MATSTQGRRTTLVNTSELVRMVDQDWELVGWDTAPLLALTTSGSSTGNIALKPMSQQMSQRDGVNTQGTKAEWYTRPTRPLSFKLAASIATTGATTFTITPAAEAAWFVAGTIVKIEDETILCTAGNPSTGVVTVDASVGRGYAGSTAATHTAGSVDEVFILQSGLNENDTVSDIVNQESDSYWNAFAGMYEAWGASNKVINTSYYDRKSNPMDIDEAEAMVALAQKMERQLIEGSRLVSTGQGKPGLVGGIKQFLPRTSGGIVTADVNHITNVGGAFTKSVLDTAGLTMFNEGGQNNMPTHLVTTMKGWNKLTETYYNTTAFPALQITKTQAEDLSVSKLRFIETNNMRLEIVVTPHLIKDTDMLLLNPMHIKPGFFEFNNTDADGSRKEFGFGIYNMYINGPQMGRYVYGEISALYKRPTSMWNIYGWT